MTKDTTYSLLVQESIVRAKKEWEQTFDAVTDLIFIVDNNYNIIRANRAMSKRCGLTPQELVGRKCHEVVHGKNCCPENCVQCDQDICAKSLTAELELAGLHGTFEVTLSPFFDFDGKRTASVHVARDITEKRRIEKALQESEQRFALFMEHLPLAVFIKDADGRFLFANRYMKDLINSEDLYGVTANDLFPDEISLKMSSEDHEALTQGLGLYNDVLLDSDGHEMVFDTYKFPVPCADGSMILGGISVDVTEKRRHEAMLAAQQEQLQQINSTLESRISDAVTELRNKDALLIQESRLNAMGELICNIAHQWRQPLNNIGLIVQSLQLAFKSNDLSVEELDADIADAMKALQEISATIDDFRKFLSQENTPCKFSVNEVVSRSLSMVVPSLKSSGISIVLEEQPDVTTEGFPNEYAQVFINVILNARDALLEQRIEEPLITVRIFAHNDKSHVMVRDNGGGINDDVLPKIFDPYFSTKSQAKGVGLGLYMAKTIIEKHMAGRLTVTSADGCTEFSIEL